MAPKKNARGGSSPAPPPVAAAQPIVTPEPVVKPVAPKATSSSSSGGNANTWDRVLLNLYNYYIKETPQRTELLDVFLVFLAVVGALQFLYCILAGNYVRGQMIIEEELFGWMLDANDCNWKK